MQTFPNPFNSLIIPFSSPLHFPPGISDSDQLLHASSEIHLMGLEAQKGHSYTDINCGKKHRGKQMG